MKTTYADLLPRESLFNYQLCCHLDNAGEKCAEPAFIEAYTFEDRTTVPAADNNWYVIYLCKNHAKSRGIDLRETQNYN